MNTTEFNAINETLFPSRVLAFFNDGTQYGFNNFIDKEITKVGYSINLTKDVIKQAIAEEVDLILTHHDVWEEMVGMREDISHLLEQHGIVHYFNHTPLDSVSFGPTGQLAKALQVKVVENICFWDAFSFGVVGEFEEAITLEELEQRLNQTLGHKARVFKHNDKQIKRVGIVAGSGADLETIYEAITHHCDAYITGEKKLKTIVYTKHMQLNFLLGSHLFTELGGIIEYARLLSEKMPNITFVNLKEEHIE